MGWLLKTLIKYITIGALNDFGWHVVIPAITELRSGKVKLFSANSYIIPILSRPSLGKDLGFLNSMVESSIHLMYYIILIKVFGNKC
jgi:hypothetical protein